MNIIPPAPLFRDPIFDGAADPTVIWNREEKAWWIFYTARRANGFNIGVSYCHGTQIGIASSSDQGKSWIYRGTAELLFEPGMNTFWAPEVIWAEGEYHMYVTYLRGVPSTWSGKRQILHFTSADLWHWECQGVIPLSSEHVIDAAVYPVENGKWKLWYKDEEHQSHTFAAESKDLYHWTVVGEEISDCPHEGPNVFELGGDYWMITDPWEGLGVYRSSDAKNWVRCPNVLDVPGTREDDGVIGGHADVLVHKGRAYLFYFTHPEVSLEQRRNPDFIWEENHRRTSLQVAELKKSGDLLICDRNRVEIDLS